MGLWWISGFEGIWRGREYLKIVLGYMDDIKNTIVI
jgi:hypothetical protein